MKEAELVHAAAHDVELELMGVDLDVDLCHAGHVILAFFQKLRDRTSGWRLWQRAVYAGAIGALELLLASRCKG
mgnify:CR=1 FL=1